MTTDASKSPEEVLQRPAEAGTALTPEDRLTARLRGFGPLGILASLVVLALGPILEPFGPLAAVAIIYWNVESRVAHQVFR